MSLPKFVFASVTQSRAENRSQEDGQVIVVPVADEDTVTVTFRPKLAIHTTLVAVA